MLPVSWNGSVTIYTRVIRPFFLRHEREIDSAIDRAVDATRSALKDGQLHLLFTLLTITLLYRCFFSVKSSSLKVLRKPVISAVGFLCNVNRLLKHQSVCHLTYTLLALTLGCYSSAFMCLLVKWIFVELWSNFGLKSSHPISMSQQSSS